MSLCLIRCVTMQETWTIVTIVLYATLDVNEVIEDMLPAGTRCGTMFRHWAVCFIISPIFSMILLIGPMSAMAIASARTDPPIIMSYMEMYTFVGAVLSAVKNSRELLKSSMCLAPILYQRHVFGEWPGRLLHSSMFETSSFLSCAF